MTWKPYAHNWRCIVKRFWIMLAAAMLVAVLAAPAAADKPVKPGRPDGGAGLEVTVEPVSNFMWVNSAGDVVDFAITVTNRTNGPLPAVNVKWDTEILATFDLAKGASSSLEYEYTFTDDAFELANDLELDEMSAGTVTASADGVGDASSEAVLTLALVEPCGFNDEGEVTLTADDPLAVCSFTAYPDPDPDDPYWMLETTMAKKRPVRVSTVRDGIPGNWCMGDPVIDGTTATQTLVFPAVYDENGDIVEDADIVCADGGAGGESIPVRNTNTFYLATWAGNTATVTAVPTN